MLLKSILRADAAVILFAVVKTTLNWYVFVPAVGAVSTVVSAIEKLSVAAVVLVRDRVLV
ncbi:hypothetical protein GE573_02721 [Bacillus velezensis]|nr:hypothetical protein CHN56_01420 [Bacillus velezensis]MCW5196025.1 hypothetical protein [Bacillus amyloliquefaciens]ATC52083.1 hypothetical protein CLI97_02838 [Bacillus velezensis]QNV53734.1 hypothetical protein GE573_02721 [Bacillus velezensis]RCX27971.1 hypothetical protein DEU43_111108 [Bacillus amyloliquefaciens]